MSISTYAELQTAIGNWLNRTDLSPRYEEFIAMGEARLNRVLRLLQMETTATVTISSSANTANYPTGFLSVLTLTHSDGELLTHISPEKREEYYSSGAGKPYSYATSDRFLFERPADQAYSLTCRYVKRWNIATDSTNWLLTNSPDAYLFASLAEAEPYIMNDQRLPLWEARLQRAITELNVLDAKVRGSATLRVDEGLRYNRNALNIESGDY